VIHEPTRLQICGILAGVEEAEFGVVRDLLEVADSVMSKHLKTLEQVGYVRTRKRRAGVGRPRTWAALTDAGRTAFAGHVAELQRLAEQAEGTPT
jgi:DNA-binding MarR family transcriptional regulator